MCLESPRRGEGVIPARERRGDSYTSSHTCIFWNTNNCFAMSLPPVCLLNYDAAGPNDTVYLCSVYVCERGFQEAGVSDNGRESVFFVFFLGRCCPLWWVSAISYHLHLWLNVKKELIMNPLASHLSWLCVACKVDCLKWHVLYLEDMRTDTNKRII